MDTKHIQQNWLLPDGVADVLFTDAQKQESLRDAFAICADRTRLSLGVAAIN